MSDQTFLVAVISPEARVQEKIALALEDGPSVGNFWMLQEYPGPGHVDELGLGAGRGVVFLDFVDPVRAKATAAAIDRQHPGVAVIAVLPGNYTDLLDLMQFGIREVITKPVSQEDVLKVFERATRRLRREPESEQRGGSVFAFVPARPGSGATTIAVHAAAAAARLSQQRTLLIDFDLRLGMTSFLLKLHGEQSVLDALTFSAQMDDTLWDGLICSKEMLDILGSAPIHFSRESREGGSSEVLAFAAARYGTICVDLPGELRHHELDTIHRAKEVFLVCTPEVGTLHMAKKKVEALRLVDLSSRISIVLNRAQSRSSMPIGDIEDILQLPVGFTVPSADKEIAEATHKAIAIEGRSAIAVQMEKIARRMIAGVTVSAERPKPRKFVEFFSLTPVREKAGWKK